MAWEMRPVFAMGDHIPMDKAWILIQEGSPLSAAEAEHLNMCFDCREFLNSFVSIARYVGFSVRFPNLDHRLDRDRVA
jgi:hypothetical protein